MPKQTRTAASGRVLNPTANKKIKALLIVFALLLMVYLLLNLTPYNELKLFLNQPVSTRVYDRNGVLLQVIPVKDGVRREYVSLNELRPGTAAVFIAAEDERFYYHFGVDIISIIRAAFQNVSSGRQVSGASTITMQLARIITTSCGNSSRSKIVRKITEVFNALRLEARLSKNEILELYLNSMPFGFQTEGLASAARNFFSTEAVMLTPAQIFCLAVIPRRPSFYSPVQNPEKCKSAAQDLQKRFSLASSNKKKYPALSFITNDDWEFTLRQARRFDYPFEAPHLIRYVLNDVIGKAAQSGEKYADVTLTIDIYLQNYIEGLITANVDRYRTARLNQGAAIIIDNETGDILAWVGSADFSVENGGQIDGVLALNQPGSSMKPLLYALALERGFTPNSILADIPVIFGNEEIYIPQNFNNRFNGPVLMRQALASSLNIPAVELLYRLSVNEYSDFLIKLGFDSLKKGAASEAGLGLALGGAPVRLVELARAFTIFPNDGKLLDIQYMVQNSNKDISKEDVISRDTARIICSFLSDKEARYLAFGNARNFNADFPLIVKTGTANQYQSIVALAASRRFTCAVWMGNFSGETVIGRTGSSIPAAIARDSLVFLHKNSPSYDLAFDKPENFIKKPICAVSGLSPTAACGAVLYEYIEAGDEPPLCGWHSIENGIVRISYPANYQRWLMDSKKEGIVEHSVAELAIVTPRDGFVFLSGDGVSYSNQAIPVEVIGGGLDELQVFYDGSERTEHRPFKFFLPMDRGRHTLVVRNGEESRETTFTVK
ncbi:MAG: transglycosylase domain-containing protein [Spirochaetaceae bacterium]|nr:transglycosylase domain-containing protein [Spirochaetaceae bacterium]